MDVFLKDAIIKKCSFVKNDIPSDSEDLVIHTKTDDNYIHWMRMKGVLKWKTEVEKKVK